MAGKRPALGRGLSALLNDGTSQAPSDEVKKEIAGGVALLPIAVIEVNPYQPRTTFKEEALDELAQSIRELGVIQPITVRQLENSFQIISGERRFRASQRAGLTEIPAFVRIADDQTMLEMALVENIQRQDLDAIEIALTYQRLIEECALTQEEMSQRVGKKRSTITNYLRLLKLNPLLQAGIRDAHLSMGHARALVNVSDEDLQIELYKRIMAEGLSVRQVEALVRDAGAPKSSSKNRSLPLPFDFQQARENLSNRLDTPTKIERNAKGQGRIVIPFASDGDFKRILSALKAGERE